MLDIYRDRERRGGSRDRERRGDSRDRGRRAPSPNNDYLGPAWIPRKMRGCVSNFDVMPPHGMELPPIAITAAATGVPNSYLSYHNPPPPSVAAARPLAGTTSLAIPKVLYAFHSFITTIITLV
jgi:hypothetical protein